MDSPAFLAVLLSRATGLLSIAGAVRKTGSVVTETLSPSRFAKFRQDYSALFQRSDQDQIRDDLRTFFGPRADKYLAIYERMRTGNKSYAPGWNWVVFFTMFPWYFYRKMYIFGSLSIFLPPLAGYLFGLTGNAGLVGALAVSANSQYVQSAMKRLQKADELGLIGERRQKYLQRAGGVSIVAGTLTGILFALMIALLVLSLYLEHHNPAH
jgi:hypothetical protein